MEYVYPDKRILICWSVYGCLTAIVPALLSSWLLALPIIPRWISLTFTITWGAGYAFLLAIFFPLRRRCLCYHIDDDGITVISGVLFKNSRRFPYDTIRHYIVFDGPIERFFGIRSVLLCATGGRLMLEGLTSDKVTALTRRVV